MKTLVSILLCAALSTSASAVVFRGVEVGDARFIAGNLHSTLVLSKGECKIEDKVFGDAIAYLFTPEGVRQGCVIEFEGEPTVVFKVGDRAHLFPLPELHKFDENSHCFATACGVNKYEIMWKSHK